MMEDDDDERFPGCVVDTRCVLLFGHDGDCVGKRTTVEDYRIKIPCNEWNPLFGIAGALANINCKLNEGHEGEHEVVITLGRNPTTQHTIHWKTVEIVS